VCFEHWDGEHCDVEEEARCMTHCSRRGDCVLGFCHCQEGFFGVDCSLTLSPDGRVQRQRWWEDTDLVSFSAQSDGHAWWEQQQQQQQQQGSGEGATAVQQQQGTAQEPTTQSASARHVMQSATAEQPRNSSDAAAPSVYVYDLPPEFNVHYLPGSPLHHKVTSPVLLVGG
jgi:hypothetical protein